MLVTCACHILPSGVATCMDCGRGHGVSIAGAGSADWVVGVERAHPAGGVVLTCGGTVGGAGDMVGPSWGLHA